MAGQLSLRAGRLLLPGCRCKLPGQRSAARRELRVVRKYESLSFSAFLLFLIEY